MEPFNIHILGCGSALPTLRHNASSQVVEVRGKLFMVDCAEGTQMQLRRSRLRFTKLSAVFITHLHGDHCFGLIGMISTFGMLGRTAALNVYAPKELEPVLQMQLEVFCRGLEFEVKFHAVDPTRNAVVYEDRSLTVETLPLDHRVPCCGYLFREKPTARHLNREACDAQGVPVDHLHLIKGGMDWTRADGTVIPNAELTLPPDPPRAYAYCSDTAYKPDLASLVEGVDLLYHESTYAEDSRERANLFHHSTAADAARIAKVAHVGRLMLGHYSARYEDEKVLLAEAKSIFPNSFLSNEGMVVSVE